MFKSSAKMNDVVPRRRHVLVRENDPYEKIATASDRIVAALFAQIHGVISDEEIKRRAFLAMSEILGDLYADYLRPVICSDIDRSIQRLLDQEVIVVVPEEVFGGYNWFQTSHMTVAYRVTSMLHRLALLDL